MSSRSFFVPLDLLPRWRATCRRRSSAVRRGFEFLTVLTFIACWCRAASCLGGLGAQRASYICRERDIGMRRMPVRSGVYVVATRAGGAYVGASADIDAEVARLRLCASSAALPAFVAAQGGATRELPLCTARPSPGCRDSRVLFLRLSAIAAPHFTVTAPPLHSDEHSSLLTPRQN